MIEYIYKTKYRVNTMKNKSNPLIIITELMLKAAILITSFGGICLQAIIDGGFFNLKYICILQ